MLKNRGFTIVELLIVIVVIAILAAITIVAYNGIQTRAKASAIISDLKATEKAFKLYKASSGANMWWKDDDSALTGSGNPSISQIISSQADYKNYLQKAPTTDGLGAPGVWIYDNEQDVYNGCSISTAGVNLGIANATNTDLMQAIDTTLDDGNLYCGKIRISSGWFLYTISNQS